VARTDLRAVLFDYGLTLVSHTFPRAELLAMLEGVRPCLGGDPPSAERLLSDVLERVEVDLPGTGGGLDEIDYLDFYDRAWRRAGVQASRATLYRILDLEQRCWEGAVRLAPDALPTLARLRDRGLRLGVASNAPFPPEMLHRQLEGNGIAAAVDAAVFSSEVGRRKPAPELYLAALEKIGVAPTEALYVGDRRLEDYEGPRRLGMNAILCTALAREPVGDAVPTIPRLADLDPVIDALQGGRRS
jgi:HAD superfamily hydrolase (TIGR01549 family)